MGLTNEARRMRDIMRGPLEWAECCTYSYHGHRNTARWRNCLKCKQPLVYSDPREKKPEPNNNDMDPLEVLKEIFDGLPEPGQPTVKGGGRIGGVLNPHTEGPITVAVAWLKQYGVPIRQVDDCELPPNVMAQFCFNPHHVRIPISARLRSSDTMQTVWHEVAHAADFVPREGREQPARPWGYYSFRHRDLLLKNMDAILEWGLGGAKSYREHPVELWAEAASYAIMDPGRMPELLLCGILPDLVELKLPVYADNNNPPAAGQTPGR